MQASNGAKVRSLAHLVSYASDSDDERPKEGEKEEEMEELHKIEEESNEGEEIGVFSLEETKPKLIQGTSLVSYMTGEEEGMKEEDDADVQGEGQGMPGPGSELRYEADDSFDVEDHLENIKLVDTSYLSASMSLPESALSQKIRRLSADEVTLPQEPQGRCSRQLQEKFNSYYKKNQDLNQLIQKRKDFRNPSIYEKLINYLGIDEVGTNYPKDMYDPYCWGEGSYYEALAKAQKDEIQKRKEKDKKERTKVEFVTGMAKKPQIQAPLVTSTTGAVASTSSSQGTGHEEKKRKSKWDNPSQPLPPPLPLMQRPLISLVTTTVTATSVVSTTTSATGSKTTVISSIGTIKKPKVEK